jgi:hypothetical protein
VTSNVDVRLVYKDVLERCLTKAYRAIARRLPRSENEESEQVINRGVNSNDACRKHVGAVIPVPRTRSSFNVSAVMS